MGRVLVTISGFTCVLDSVVVHKNADYIIRFVWRISTSYYNTETFVERYPTFNPRWLNASSVAPRCCGPCCVTLSHETDRPKTIVHLVVHSTDGRAMVVPVQHNESIVQGSATCLWRYVTRDRARVVICFIKYSNKYLRYADQYGSWFLSSYRARSCKAILARSCSHIGPLL